MRRLAVVLSGVAVVFAGAVVALGERSGGRSGPPDLAAADTGRRLTRQQVLDALSRATDKAPADFAGDDLSGLDLSGVDFKQANLSRARLVGTRFVRAKMFGVTLRSEERRVGKECRSWGRPGK